MRGKLLMILPYVRKRRRHPCGALLAAATSILLLCKSECFNLARWHSTTQRQLAPNDQEGIMSALERSPVLDAKSRDMISTSRAPRLRSHGGAGVTVEVKHAVRNPVDVSQLSTCGSTFYANGYDAENKDGWVLMQSIAGIAEGQDVIAITEPGKHSVGKAVEVDKQYIATKPKGLGWDRAAMLPFLAISSLCPLQEAGFNRSNAVGQSFVVTGGHGSLAPFVVQVLNAWGGKISCATTRSHGAVRSLGVDTTVDFRKQSYSDETVDIDMVVDTLGRETEGAQRMLMEAKGASYVSLQPRILKVAMDEGVLFGAGKLFQYQKMIAKDEVRTYFLPNAGAMEVVSHVVDLAHEKKINLAAVGTEYVGMQEYMEALSWPKDTDTGLRFGFPGKTGIEWGWLEAPYEEEDTEEFDEEHIGEGAKVEVVQGDSRSRKAWPRGQIARIKTSEDLRDIAREETTIIFVSSRSCRACKFLSPFYQKLARKQVEVLFATIDATSLPELARSLGLTVVPSFVTFKGGKVTASQGTSSKERIEKLVDQLLT